MGLRVSVGKQESIQTSSRTTLGLFFFAVGRRRLALASRPQRACPAAWLTDWLAGRPPAASQPSRALPLPLLGGLAGLPSHLWLPGRLTGSLATLAIVICM